MPEISRSARGKVQSKTNIFHGFYYTKQLAGLLLNISCISATKAILHMLWFMYGYIAHVMVYVWLFYACYGLCMAILPMLWLRLCYGVIVG